MEELINPCSMRELTNTCKLVLPVSARIYVYGAGKNGKAGLARTIPKRDKTGQNGKESEVHLPDVAMVDLGIDGLRMVRMNDARKNRG